jgi:hypothetical protein
MDKEIDGYLRIEADFFMADADGFEQAAVDGLGEVSRAW